MFYTLYGQQIENVHHVKYAGDGDAAELAAIADIYNTWEIDTLMPLLSSALTYRGIEVRDLAVPAGAIGVAVPEAPIDGSITEDSLPGGTAFVISLRSGLAGRSARGRTYVAGIPISKKTGNQVVGSFASDLVSAFNDLIALLEAAGHFLVVVSRFAELVERVVPATFTITTATAVDTNLDSQRRRLNGRGS